jgi:hypothetical protein
MRTFVENGLKVPDHNFNELPHHERYRRAAFLFGIVLCIFAAASGVTGFSIDTVFWSRMAAITVLFAVGLALTFSPFAREHCSLFGMLTSLTFLGHQFIAITVSGLSSQLCMTLLLTVIVNGLRYVDFTYDHVMGVTGRTLCKSIPQPASATALRRLRSNGNSSGFATSPSRVRKRQTGATRGSAGSADSSKDIRGHQ